MENSQPTSQQTANPSSNSWWVISTIIAMVVLVIIWFVFLKEEKPPVVNEPEIPQVVEVEPEVEIIAAEPELIEPEASIAEVVIEQGPILPTLDESDAWLEEKLPTITWRKELLKLVIDDDMIRRFVVFTDNFSQGILAYEHSPLIKPTTSFSGREINENGQVVIKWDNSSSRRFSLYVDLLRSIDSDTLVSWYYELKPLVDEAYRELGYPDEDFTDILQDAITKVLDMEIPKERLELIRPSVMYQYKSEEIEQLDDSDKLMLRLGKENLLVIKSVLLEISEKIARERD